MTKGRILRDRPQKKIGLGAGAALSRDMRACGKYGRRSSRLVIFCAVAGMVLGLLPNAHAKTRSHRKRHSGFAVALQPFALVHSAVHAVAAPIIFNAPRAIAAVATKPIRVAYYVAHPASARPPRNDDADESEANAAPTRVAYEINRPSSVPAPRAEAVDNENQEAESFPEIESSGAHPTVGGTQRSCATASLTPHPARPKM